MNSRLDRRTAAIIGAFTGISCGPFEDIHGYVDSLPGFKGIMTHNFADKKVWADIKEACRADFVALCADREEDTPEWLKVEKDAKVVV
jgi:hypothetical protein